MSTLGAGKALLSLAQSTPTAPKLACSRSQNPRITRSRTSKGLPRTWNLLEEHLGFQYPELGTKRYTNTMRSCQYPCDEMDGSCCLATAASWTVLAITSTGASGCEHGVQRCCRVTGSRKKSKQVERDVSPDINTHRQVRTSNYCTHTGNNYPCDEPAVACKHMARLW